MWPRFLGILVFAKKPWPRDKARQYVIKKALHFENFYSSAYTIAGMQIASCMTDEFYFAYDKDFSTGDVLLSYKK